MSVETTVNGLAALERMLSELPEKVQVKIARASMAAGARVVRDEARRIVPVKTGALKASIRVGTGRSKNGMIFANVRAGGKNRKGDAFYSHFVEFGTLPHAIAPKKKGGRKALKFAGRFAASALVPATRPKPFMRPALDGKWREAVDTVGGAMAARIGEVVK